MTLRKHLQSDACPPPHHVRVKGRVRSSLGTGTPAPMSALHHSGVRRAIPLRAPATGISPMQPSRGWWSRVLLTPWSGGIFSPAGVVGGRWRSEKDFESWRSEKDFESWVSRPDFAAGQPQHRTSGSVGTASELWSFDVLDSEAPAPTG